MFWKTLLTAAVLAIAVEGSAVVQRSVGEDKTVQGTGESQVAKPDHDRYYLLGQEAIEGERWNQAIKDLKRSIARDATNINAHNLLGFAYRKRAGLDLEASQQSYEEALLRDENFAEALEYQGELFVWQGRIQEAHANYLKLLDLGATEEAEELRAVLEPVILQAQRIRLDP